MWSVYETLQTGFNKQIDKHSKRLEGTTAFKYLFRPSPESEIDQPPPERVESKKPGKVLRIPEGVKVFSLDTEEWMNPMKWHAKAYNQMRDDIGPAVQAFQRKFRRSWRPAYVPASRGVLYCKGTVEIAGTKAAVLFEVTAAYHPATNKIETVDFITKRVYSYKHYPLR
jgi:hypothetical protein